MIENHLQPETGTGYLLLCPNRSLSWQGNKRLLAALAALMLGASAGFAALGLWLILPFAGLELLALTAALYATSRRQYDREVIVFTDAEIRLERGRLRPVETLRVPRGRARFVVRPSPYRSHPRRVMLRCHGREVELARWLGEEERGELIRALRAFTHAAGP